MMSLFRFWRPTPESNRATRICSPLHNQSASGPYQRLFLIIRDFHHNSITRRWMMHIRKLVSGRYQCMIRLQGVSTSKTFQDKQSAKIWGQEQELSIVGGHPHDSSSKYTLSDLITRYLSECVPHLNS